MSWCRYLSGLVIGSLATALGLCLWRLRSPEDVPAGPCWPHPVSPTIAYDPAKPTWLTIGDGRFLVRISLDPNADIPEWWWGWDNNGGIAAISLSGMPFLTARGMPEEWKPFEPQGPFMPGTGWGKRPDGQGGQLPSCKSPVQVTIQGGTITCRQDLPLWNGYSYCYEKRLTIRPKAATIIIDYRMDNTGSKPLRWWNFCHGYWTLGAPIGPGLELRTPLRPERCPDWLLAHAHGMDLAKTINQPCFAPNGPPAPAWANRIEIRDRRTGQVLDLQGDYPSQFALYAEPGAIIPEAKLKMDLAPGATQRWQRRFRFRYQAP